MSNIPYNPSLVTQITFYVGRMKAEAGIRRLGLICMSLALFVQMFAVIAPPKPTLANSTNDILNGGFTSQAQAVQYCQGNVQNFAVILEYHKVSCDQLASSSTQTKSIRSTDYGGALYSMGRQSQGPVIQRTGKATNEFSISVGGGIYYMRKLSAWDSGAYSTYKMLGTTNRDGVTILIMFDCGNIATIDRYTPPPVPKPPTPQPPTPQPPTPKPPTPKPPTPTIPEVDPNIMLDVATCDAKTKKALFTGWAFDSDRPSKSIKVELYIDGEKIATLGADKVRPDINTTYGLTGSHGFSFNPTLSSGKFTDGQQHTTYVIALGVDKNGVADGRNKQSNSVAFGPCSELDACPEKAGTQKSEEECEVDVCLEVPGTQTDKKDCPEDVCPYVDGNQTKKSECDVCPDISGEQSNTSMCKPCDRSTDESDKTVCLVYGKTAENKTQKIANADGTTAKAGDSIEYMLSVTNTGKVKVDNFTIEEDVNDILQYADITNLHGGKKDANGIVRWENVDIAAEKTVTKKLTIKIKNPIPNTPISASNPGSFDLTLTNVYQGNAVNILLPRSLIKTTEQATKVIPNTGPGSSLALIFGVTLVAGYLFARSRLLAKELGILREEYAQA